jgi:hypothetical protein
MGLRPEWIQTSLRIQLILSMKGNVKKITDIVQKIFSTKMKLNLTKGHINDSAVNGMLKVKRVFSYLA